MELIINKKSSIIGNLFLFIAGIYCFSCSAYIISPGIRSDNAVSNIEKPSIIRNDRIKNDNLMVSLFIPRGNDLEEVFYDENNFIPENEVYRNKLPILLEKAKESKNIVLVQTEYNKNMEAMRQIKSIQLNLKDCIPIQSLSYQYNFIRFTKPYVGVRSRSTYPKKPESSYREEMQPVTAYTRMKEIPTLRSIFIFNKDCTIDSKDILEIKIETDETLIFKFQNAR